MQLHVKVQTHCRTIHAGNTYASVLHGYGLMHTSTNKLMFDCWPQSTMTVSCNYVFHVRQCGSVTVWPVQASDTQSIDMICVSIMIWT